jgi:hypothetical protein
MPHNAVAKGPILPCEEPIEFEYLGGRFYLRDPALGFTRVMQFDILLRSFQGCAAAIQEYYRLSEGQFEAEIIPFPKRL